MLERLVFLFNPMKLFWLTYFYSVRILHHFMSSLTIQAANDYKICSCLVDKHTSIPLAPKVVDTDLLPVGSRTISSQEINSLEIDIPRFNDDDGPIRYCTVNIYNCYFVFPIAVTTSLW